MLVRVQPGSGDSREGLSGAEQHVVDLARGWTGQYQLPGLLLANVTVADRATTRQVDGVLISPHGLIVLEIKGITRPQPGNWPRR